MVKAVWKGKTIAKSDNVEKLEGNYYFPIGSVNKKYLRESYSHSQCPWKGKAHYYDVVVDGEVNKDAAWYYPDPKPQASNIKGYIAFWKGIEVRE